MSNPFKKVFNGITKGMKDAYGIDTKGKHREELKITQRVLQELQAKNKVYSFHIDKVLELIKSELRAIDEGKFF